MDMHHVLLGTKTECKFIYAFFNISNCRHIRYLAVCFFFWAGFFTCPYHGPDAVMPILVAKRGQVGRSSCSYLQYTRKPLLCVILSQGLSMAMYC